MMLHVKSGSVPMIGAVRTRVVLPTLGGWLSTLIMMHKDWLLLLPVQLLLLSKLLLLLWAGSVCGGIFRLVGSLFCTCRWPACETERFLRSRVEWLQTTFAKSVGWQGRFDLWWSCLRRIKVGHRLWFQTHTVVAKWLHPVDFFWLVRLLWLLL